MLKIPFILICSHDRKSVALQRLSDLYVLQKLWKNIYTRVKTITCVRRCTQANKLAIVAITIDRYSTQARSRYRKSAFQGRSQDFFRGTHNFQYSVGNNCHPPPSPPSPIKTVATQGHSQTDFHKASFARAQGANF